MGMLKNAKFLFILFLISTQVRAQDTLKINIRQADSIFLKNSFYLLASSMNIEAQKAQVIQAKLYPNPIFTANVNAYDSENNIFFHIGETGQKVFQLEQLILLGGKRKAEIEMVKTNTVIAELEFQQLAKNLKFQLYSNLYSAGQQEFLLHKYNEQLTLLDSLLSTYQVQADKGNIPLKEVVRLKGAYLKLNNGRAELFRDYFAAQSILRKILQVSSIIQFEYSEEDISRYVKLISLADIQSTASTHRPDLLIMQQSNILSKQYLQYQKKLAIPDINLFTSYDQRSGAFQNQIDAGISIPLHLWNRNQGNIKAAQFKLQETDYQIQSVQNEIASEIQNAYTVYMQTVSEYEKSNKLYNQDFETTLKAMTDNFQKQNVSIIEFIDFFEAHNEVLTELTRIKTQLVSSAEKLNFLTGASIY